MFEMHWLEAAALAAAALWWGAACVQQLDKKYARSRRYMWCYYVGYLGWSLWLLSWASNLSGVLSLGGNMWGATLIIVPLVAWHMGECWRIEGLIDQNKEAAEKIRKGQLMKRVSTALFLMNFVLLWQYGM